MTSNNEFRESVQNVLLLLSSQEQQLQRHQKSPSTNITLDLLCLWFNELYNPGSFLFKRAFSESEYASIQEFNRYYDRVKGNLPESIEQMFLDKNWIEINQQAKILLYEISEL